MAFLRDETRTELMWVIFYLEQTHWVGLL